jgi:hypothetical protein
MRRKTVPVLLKAWIDRSRCGQIEKLSRDFLLSEDIAKLMQIKVPFRCEPAAAFLDRLDDPLIAAS